MQLKDFYHHDPLLDIKLFTVNLFVNGYIDGDIFLIELPLTLLHHYCHYLNDLQGVFLFRRNIT